LATRSFGRNAANQKKYYGGSPNEIEKEDAKILIIGVK